MSKTFKRRSVSLSSIRNRSHSPRRTLSLVVPGRGIVAGTEVRSIKIVPEGRRDDVLSHTLLRKSDTEEVVTIRVRGKGKNGNGIEIPITGLIESIERSRERSRNSRGGNRSRVQRVLPPHYMGQIPVPIYYNHFPPRPIMMGPLMPMRGQVLLGSRHPSMMGPPWPFSPSLRSSNHIKYRSKKF